MWTSEFTSVLFPSGCSRVASHEEHRVDELIPAVLVHLKSASTRHDPRVVRYLQA